MSELTNKELASWLRNLHSLKKAVMAFDYWPELEIAAERLAQYPDMHHTEATNFRDLASKFLKMRDYRDRLQSIIDSMVDQRSKLHSRFKDRKGQANPEADLMAPNDHIADAGEMGDRNVETNKTMGVREPVASITLARNLFNGEVVKLYWENFSLGPGTHNLYTQPQQPAPDKETVRQLFNKYHNDRYNPASEHYRFEHFWDDLFSLFTPPRLSPLEDKETIKQYCLEFARYWDDIAVTTMSMEEVFRKWWQQQSAEGGE